mgnify:CR=1 FL=1|tara:strand:+ start:2172 stop:2660 length:489 start_codon:yes stop_codon:yes gene_type:complete
MGVINTSAGDEAVLHIYDLVGAGNVEFVTANVTSVPFMQDVTINNSTGTFRYKTLDSSSESVVTTPATNQLSLNAIVDDGVFFGGVNATNFGTEGLIGTSDSKTQIGFHIYFNGVDVGSRYLKGIGFIGGLSPTVNPDAPLWVTPVTLEVNGDYSSLTVVAP